MKDKSDIKETLEVNVMLNGKNIGSFYDYLVENEYLFDKETIENYLLSLKVKPFVILTGNSGTGKTKLSQLFAEYLMEKNSYYREIEMSFEEDSEGYIKFRENDSSKTSDSFDLGETTILSLLSAYYNYYIMDFKVDGIKITRPIFLHFFAKSNDKELLKYLNSLDNLSDIEIKIRKKDLMDTFTKHQIKENNKISFNKAIKDIPYYLFPSAVLTNVLNIKKGFVWNAIVEGIETTFEFGIREISFTLNPSENEDLKPIFAKKDIGDNIEIEADLSTLREFKNYKILPVGANWTENRHIVGFHNVISNEYQTTPARDLIIQSQKIPEPHFLILDEMNLSHVERYFADFLSAIESGEEIPLYSEKEKDLKIPPNLFIIGTVNVDETTYMFSPKVLDRANVLEFETYSASAYMNNEINFESPSENISYLENPLSHRDIRAWGINELREVFYEVYVGREPFWDVLSGEIDSFQTILKKSGFDFGFRVINEIVRFMVVAWEYENQPSDFTEWRRYFDACIKQKMLPKLHGSQKIIEETLYLLLKACLNDLNGTEIDSKNIKFDLDKIEITKETTKYYTSAKKLEEMINILNKQRYVSFIN